MPVSQPTDAAEIEADQMADKVMRFEIPISIPKAPNGSLFVDLHVLTIKPGFELGKGQPEEWTIPIGTGEIAVEN